VFLNLPFDAAADFHNYTVVWSPARIRWFVDGRLRHTDHGKPNATIPYEPMEFALIARPSKTPAGYHGDAVMSVASFEYVSDYRAGGGDADDW
jgi:beta-glucanase (GH16 family)